MSEFLEKYGRKILMVLGGIILFWMVAWVTMATFIFNKVDTMFTTTKANHENARARLNAIYDEGQASIKRDFERHDKRMEEARKKDKAWEEEYKKSREESDKRWKELWKKRDEFFEKKDK